ncbi:MAG: YeiH family protein [Eubacterium sp.]|nr:YeiH family protein [Eubacterium sp.]
MENIKKNIIGVAVCLAIAIPSHIIGKMFPIIGGAVIAIIVGMIIALFWNEKGKAERGIKFTSKVILQTAVVLLGFGMNLGVVVETGKQSLPIIICTISISLIISYLLHRAMHIKGNTAILVGVGSSICGGSAIAATAPVVDADDDEVAQAISVIFFFNVLAALLFPTLGKMIGFDTVSGEAFGIFAGTAVNDTSSVTAAASTWDSMWNLGSQTLDKAVTVKLTRTLAIIPITLGLSFIRNKDNDSTEGFSIKRAFPMFILYFVLASVITTVAIKCGISAEFFSPVKELSKFFIVMAMAAIGLNSNVVKLVKTGGKPLIIGAFCWIGITLISLFMQYIMGIM